jgi:tetratricopeptide (TPR) repeat protein
MSRSGPPSPAPSTRPPAGSSAREREKELADYVRAGQLDRAAMVARSLGDPRSAAALFVGAGMHYQAAVCFYEAGSKEEALEAFLRIPLDDARYRRACAHAIRIGCELGSLTRALDAFVARYVAAPPEGDADLASLYQLGVLYQKSELFDHAREAFARVRSVDAAYADVAQRMSVIEPVLRNEAVYRDILRQDAASWRRPSSLAPARADDDAARQPTAADPSASLAELSARPSPSVREGPRSPGPDLAPGAIVAHRYRVEQQIGRGGMGVVYRATDLELEEAVAIKVFGHRLDEPDLVQRFKQELSICRSLAHPNIVRLHDIGAHEGRKFLSMELLAGAALDAILKRPVELRPAIQILQQACAGVGAAHRGGVVHRDVKPDNLFVTTEAS